MTYPINFDLEFRKNPYTGLYIAIEGIDASGKSTQIEKLGEYLAEKKKEYVLTSEPRDDGLVGDVIRKVLSGGVQVPSTALQYLYTANRVINHETIVEPSLQQGKVVLSSRCFWSAVAYGIMDRSEAGKYDTDNATQILVAQGILSMYHQFIVPDITFYLRTSASTALRRLSAMHKEKDIYEKKEKLVKITQGYDWLLQQFPEQFVTINGEQDEEAITKEMVKRINL